jgi:NADH dehydrogenase
MNSNNNKNANSPTNIVILGSGFAAIEVLKKLQKHYNNINDNINIKIISKDNFLLFTPMLPEVFSGMIEPRHIVSPVRSFCNKRVGEEQFFHGNVQDINFEKKIVTVKYSIGRYYQPISYEQKEFKFDYLVIALGNETNFFGNIEIEKNCFTMKTINDAFVLRNHIINILEQASTEYYSTTVADAADNSRSDLIKQLLTFVVVGGGFSGIETVGELSHFVNDAIKSYYKNINPNDVKIVLVNAGDTILTEVDEDLGEYTKNILEKKEGIEFKMNRMAKSATRNKLILDNGENISTYTIIWTAGVTPDELVKRLDCEHDKKGNIKTNDTLELPNFSNIYAIGDCASTINPYSGKPYPPTAQHAIRQGQLAAKNIINNIEGKPQKRIRYKTRGTMATIGKRVGVAKIFGFKFKGLIAWFLWRSFYLSKLPMLKKKLRVLGDWSMELVFHSDISMIKGYIEESHDKDIKENKKNNNNNNDNIINDNKRKIEYDKTEIKT